MRWLLASLISLLGCQAEPTPAPKSAPEADPHARPPGPTGDGDGDGDGDGEHDAEHGAVAAARKRECIASGLVGAAPRDHGLVRSVCAEWVEREIPGVVLAIVEPEQPPFVLALGQRCAGDPAPVEADTRFRFGSISKTFTAALALGLVAERRLGLDARPSTQLSAYANQAGLPEPTLELLLRHRSGLGEIVPAQLVELDGAWLPALGRSPAAGAPGSYHYSNAGYSLIGAMLEATSGDDYAQLIQARIAAPLELGTITAIPSTAAPAACGHLDGDDGDDARQPVAITDDLAFMPGDPRWMNAAGGVIGSAADLARFALALGSERLPGSAAMLEPGEPLPSASARPSRPDERYGLGLRSWALDEHTRAYGHSGNNLAFAAELLFVPGRRAIVLLANCGAGLPASVVAAERSLTH